MPEFLVYLLYIFAGVVYFRLVPAGEETCSYPRQQLLSCIDNKCVYVWLVSNCNNEYYLKWSWGVAGIFSYFFYDWCG